MCSLVTARPTLSHVGTFVIRWTSFAFLPGTLCQAAACSREAQRELRTNEEGRFHMSPFYWLKDHLVSFSQYWVYPCHQQICRQNTICNLHELIDLDVVSYIVSQARERSVVWLMQFLSISFLSAETMKPTKLLEYVISKLQIQLFSYPHPRTGTWKKGQCPPKTQQASMI